MGVNLSLRSLGKILKSTLSRQIGLYCLMVFASWTLGTSYYPKFILFRSSLFMLKSSTIPIISFFTYIQSFLKKMTIDSDFIPLIDLATSVSESEIQEHLLCCSQLILHRIKEYVQKNMYELWNIKLQCFKNLVRFRR
jgi:hypothetical protein